MATKRAVRILRECILVPVFDEVDKCKCKEKNTIINLDKIKIKYCNEKVVDVGPYMHYAYENSHNVAEQESSFGCKIFCMLTLKFFIVVVLWSGCFVKWIEILTRGRVVPNTWTDCKLSFYLFYFGRHYSSMLLVLMSIEKCFAVYFPLKSKTVCTVRTAKWATGIMGVVLAGYNIVQFL